MNTNSPFEVVLHPVLFDEGYKKAITFTDSSSVAATLFPIYFIPTLIEMESTKLFVFATLLVSALGGIVPRRAVVPINDGKYLLETRVTLTGILTVKVTVESKGWVGWGISPTGEMAGSDMVIGGFNADTGEAYIGDRFASGHGVPALDTIQNVELISASENATHTILEFSRAVDTGDVDQDLRVENAIQHIVWAAGETDDLAYHGQVDRGHIHINLMDG
ncbi:DBH-like monooxygenase protein 2 homolog [Folsomia candida]|uniref:DBH-like monooxygenase protein 2 n=1 Tax=Folsomia candida TaxID=158441 RepID=A0A226EBK3_FOLCA|nr:DBH-like monooxygenase protein 2 homolog [Folsomia candida]OXA54578.1 DBH-like monooxygenase protein 2 [Folsomia candida]